MRSISSVIPAREQPTSSTPDAVKAPWITTVQATDVTGFDHPLSLLIFMERRQIRGSEIGFQKGRARK